jgi:hypothetical protein
VKIATGSAEQHETPLPLDPQPAVAPPTPVASPPAPGAPARDTTGERLSQLAAGEADVRAAQASGMAAERDRRAHYGSDVLPVGASYGDPMTLPPVVSDYSKHTAGSDSTSYDPAG